MKEHIWDLSLPKVSTQWISCTFLFTIAFSSIFQRNFVFYWFRSEVKKVLTDQLDQKHNQREYIRVMASCHDMLAGWMKIMGLTVNL